MPRNLKPSFCGVTGLSLALVLLGLAPIAQANEQEEPRGQAPSAVIAQHLCKAGKLSVIPAAYDLTRGNVRFPPALPVGAHH